MNEKILQKDFIFMKSQKINQIEQHRSKLNFYSF